MKKKRSVTKKPSVSIAGHQAPEKPSVRAQKRLVTQNDRDELAGMTPQQTQGQPVESECDKESQ